MLSGMLYCADCGQKLYQVRCKDWTYDKYHFVCGTYRKIKGGCKSHQIRNVAIEKILQDSIRQITSYARDHESEFVEMVANKSQAEIIREFIEKVYVYHPEKINGQKTQRVRIVWNCIGEIPTQNKTA